MDRPHSFRMGIPPECSCWPGQAVLTLRMGFHKSAKDENQRRARRTSVGGLRIAREVHARPLRVYRAAPRTLGLSTLDEPCPTDMCLVALVFCSW